MAQSQIQHCLWKHAFTFSPVVSTPLEDSVETYLIARNNEVYVRLNMGASKLLAYYSDDIGTLEMSSLFSEYRQSFNTYLKNIALQAESIEADILTSTMRGMMHASPDAQGYRCRYCGYVDSSRHMFNGAMNCIYCQQDVLAPSIVPDSEWDNR